MQTLKEMLDMLDNEWSGKYNVVFRSRRGIQLTFDWHCDQGEFIVRCERPHASTPKFYRTSMDAHGYWKYAVARTFYLKLDVPCWSVDPMTISNIELACKQLDCEKTNWKRYL